MSKNELILALLGSAAIGALCSSFVTLIGRRLERGARQRELLLAASVGLAKVWVGRNASLSGHATVMEMAAIPRRVGE
jgi:hypothetical protein